MPTSRHQLAAAKSDLDSIGKYHENDATARPTSDKRASTILWLFVRTRTLSCAARETYTDASSCLVVELLRALALPLHHRLQLF